MAKITYTKLGLKFNDEVSIIHNENGTEIEVKKYLPTQDKLEIFQKVVNSALEADIRTYSIPQVIINLQMEMIYNYTNITFTEKQKENVYKLYDAFKTSGVLYDILVLCKSDYEEIKDWVLDILYKLYQQYNSVRGILEHLNTDYNNLNFDVNDLAQKLSDPESLTLLKDVLTNLG